MTNHPNPIQARESWTDLCGTWQFSFDESFDSVIVVPFPPESPLSGIGDTGFHPIAWYRRTFAATPAAGHRVVLHFGAVDYRCRVWVDGELVGSHEGGHSSFALDITDALDGSEEHVLIVRAEDDPHDPGQPRGKQDWQAEPHVIWYHRTTGIWQPVWLEEVPAVSIGSITWVPDIVRGMISGELEVSGVHAGATLDVTARLGDELLAQVTVLVTAPRLTVELPLPQLANDQDSNRLLWTPDQPRLVDIVSTLRSGQDADTVASYVGLRSCGFANGRFLLNGKPYYLRLVLEQGFWPESHLAAPSAEAIDSEVKLVRKLGFNGVRIHQKVEDPRFLAACDRIGVLVWGEMAAAYEFSRTAMERTTREWLDVVRRDRGHPAIVAWVPINESWGVPQVGSEADQQAFATALYHLTRALDPTRPTMSNEGWEHTVSDVWGVHDYSQDGDVLRRRFGTRQAIADTLRGPGPQRRRILLEGGGDRGQPVLVSEFGGLSYAPEPGQKLFSYGTVDDDEGYRTSLADLVGALLDCPDIAGFCYTQLTDTLQERNGLLTEDREPKLPFEVVRAIISAPPRVG